MRKLVHLSLNHPRWALAVIIGLTVLFALAFPKIRIDTDPENMLEDDQPDRIYYRQVKQDFGIYDLLVLGIVDEQGVFRPETLAQTARLVEGILQIKGVVAADVLSLTTTDNVTTADGTLIIRRIMDEVPTEEPDADRLRQAVLSNPLFADKLASSDGRALAIYIPIERKDESYRIAQEVEALAQKELQDHQQFYVAGLPVAEDTFGHEMFVQMGVTAPLAMLFIFVLLWLLFRRVSLIVPALLVAMLSVIWTMGLLIGLGFTVHIMSSMIPVFLMPIAVLDSVHILSEFYDKFPVLRKKKATILAVYEELFTPCLYTSLTTAAGFGALVTARIPPVQVFGAFIAFGVLIAWLLTIIFIPAYLSLLKEERLQQQLPAVAARRSWLSGLLTGLGHFTFFWRKAIVIAGIAGILIAGWGLSQIEVNDNPVNWFRPYHKIRVADRVLNEHFGGTYMAYLTLAGSNPDDLKRPEVMAYAEKLQQKLEATPPVGKTTSVADIVKRVRYVLHDGDPATAAIPASSDEIGQYLFLFQMSGDPDDLDNFLTVDASQANIWVQMKRGENKDMERVEQVVQQFMVENPPPPGIQVNWSGLTYINKVWQGIMVVGMLEAFLSSWGVVFVMMIFLFRSFRLALVSMVPLTFAIVFSYGILGFIGKDYDMPVAVCASLALGLAIDYAIHFLQRFKEKYKATGDLAETSAWIFGSPARAIARNALVISLGFLPLVLATLTPYVTVGVFFASLMGFSAVSTLLVMPAVMHLFGGKLLSGART